MPKKEPKRTPLPKQGKRLLDVFIHGVFFLFYGLVKYFPAPLGDFFRFIIAKTLLKTDGYTKIAEGVTLWYPYNIKLGKRVSFNDWCFISGVGGLTIGDYVRIGPRSTILTSNHVYKDADKTIFEQKLELKPVVIEDDVWIGSNVTILAGVHIGKGAVIAAGSVVSHNIKPFRVVGGVPATTMAKRISNENS